MAEYLAEVHKMEKFFDGFEVRYVPGLDNHDVDHLACIASSRAQTPPDVVIEKLSKPSVKPSETTNEAIKQDLIVIDEPEREPQYNLMHPIKMFLENQPSLDDNAEVEHIVRRSKQYHLIDDEVHIKRRGHPTTPGHSQWHMRITFIMTFNHQQSLHAWILLAYS
jgi:hypothetical protein